ncbi:unnamed protein product [Arctogadus glacialis]
MFHIEAELHVFQVEAELQVFQVEAELQVFQVEAELQPDSDPHLKALSPTQSHMNLIQLPFTAASRREAPSWERVSVSPDSPVISRADKPPGFIPVFSDAPDAFYGV